MDCITCGQAIAEKRLAALPNTTICIQCQEELEQSGQTSPMKRYDEVGVDGELISTFYVKDNYINKQQHRLNLFSEPSYDEQMEQEYELFVKPKARMRAYGMSEAFEEDEELIDEA